MIWGDGLNTNPGELQGRASQIFAAYEQLQSDLDGFQGIDVSEWRGPAARAERSMHRKITSSIERQMVVLKPAADALIEAATSFSQLKNTQHEAIARAAKWQYAYNSWGFVTSTVSGINLDPRRPFIRADLQRISVSITARLNATDATLAAKLGTYFVTEKALGLKDGITNGLKDAGEWGLDGIIGGLEWGRDKIVDAYEWGQDKVDDVINWFNDGIDAAKPAWSRLLETLGTTPRWLEDLVTKGEVPQISEILGGAAYIAAQTAGIPWNFITGEDQHFFDDGKPWSGEPQHHKQAPYGSASDIMQGAMDMYDTHDKADPNDRASIQVTPVEGENGEVRYVVAVPGTLEGLGEGGWFGRESGMDWAANLKGVGYGSTSATEGAMDAIDKAIRQDMEMRGIEGKPELLLTGHSQGGIIAANIAADEGFADKYDVKGIMSAGSPQQTIPVPENVSVYNFQNELDPIPRLDLEGMQPQLTIEDGKIQPVYNEQPHVNNITLPHNGEGLGSLSPTYTHLQQTYMDEILRLEGNPDDPNYAKLEQMNEEFAKFYPADPEKALDAYRVQFGREVAP